MNLTSLTVQQSTSNTEFLRNDEVESIYQSYKNSNIDKASVLKGLINVQQAYKSHCDELHARWKYLNFVISENYQEWTDQEFQRCISLLHGDGIGIIASDLVKQITARSPAIAGNIDYPLYGNKDIEVIDLRPFQNFAYNRDVEGYNSNLCVVRSNDNENEYKLKEVYLSSITSGGGFSPFSFLEPGTTDSQTYIFEKGWFEGCNSNSAKSDSIFRHPTDNNRSTNRCCFKHFYWLNHTECIGQTTRKQIQMPGAAEGELTTYIEADNWGWYHNSDGQVYCENLIIDSPVPILIPSNGNNTRPWYKTTVLYVPDSQLEIYNYLYRTYYDSGRQAPAGITTMSNYNTKFRQLANWWVYPGKTTYQTQYT
jgi:hypothetical protein